MRTEFNLNNVSGNSAPSAGAGDRWLVWLAVISFVIWFLLVLCAGMPGPLNLLAIPLVVLGGPATSLFLLICSASFLVRRKPRKAVSTGLIALLPPLLWGPIFWASDCVHIPLTVELGIGQFGSPSASPDGQFVTYDWSVGLMTNPSTFLIYDATDKIALSANRHLYALASKNGVAEQCAGNVTHVIGHFYKCSF